MILQKIILLFTSAETIACRIACPHRMLRGQCTNTVQLVIEGPSGNQQALVVAPRDDSFIWIVSV